MSVISTEDVKSHLNASWCDESEDLKICALIAAACEWVENFTHRCIKCVENTRYYRVDPCICAPVNCCKRRTLSLRCIPVKEIICVEQVEDDTLVKALVEGADYTIRRQGECVEILLIECYRYCDIRVKTKSGYERDDVPETIKLAMLMLVSHWYLYPSAVTEDKLYNIPYGVTPLLSAYKLELLF